MRMQRLTPMLQTGDIARAIDWYGSILGFRCTSRADGWCRLERDDVAIMFMRNAHIGEPHATATQYIHVDDVMALWESVRGRVGAEWGPEEMPYGLIEFAIKDPDGYLLSFGEPVSPSAPGKEMDRPA
jgi:catechol 2,3-dioxygenase-like lactoylglutathione lyase family enzyme